MSHFACELGCIASCEHAWFLSSLPHVLYIYVSFVPYFNLQTHEGFPWDKGLILQVPQFLILTLFVYPIRTWTYPRLQDQLPARCQVKPTNSRKHNFGTLTINRLPCRSDNPSLKWQGNRQCLYRLDVAARSCTRQNFRGGSHHAGSRPKRRKADSLTCRNDLSG